MTADYSIWVSKYLQSLNSLGGYERGELIHSKMVRLEQSVFLFTEIDTDYRYVLEFGLVVFTKFFLYLEVTDRSCLVIVFKLVLFIGF